MESSQLIRKHVKIVIDEHEFFMYIMIDKPSYISILEPLFLVDDIMFGIMGINKPLQHPFFKKNKENACIFNRFSKEELPQELIPRLGTDEFLYLFTEYGYTLFLLQTTSGKTKHQATIIYDLLYEFMIDIKKNTLGGVANILQKHGVVIV